MEAKKHCEDEETKLFEKFAEIRKQLKVKLGEEFNKVIGLILTNSLKNFMKMNDDYNNN